MDSDTMSTYQDCCSDIDGADRPDEALAMLRSGCGAPSYTHLLRAVFAQVPVPRGAQLLEVGCGLGHACRLVADMYHHVRIIGTDVSRVAIAECVHLSIGYVPDRISYQVMDGAALSFPDATFDLVYCARTLMHAATPERILTEMYRVVRPGGALLVIEPDAAGDFVAGVADDLHRQALPAIHPAAGRDAYMLLLRMGLRDLTVVPYVWTRTLDEAPDVAAQVRDLMQRRGTLWARVQAFLLPETEAMRYLDQMQATITAGVWRRWTIHLVTFGYRA